MALGFAAPAPDRHYETDDEADSACRQEPARIEAGMGQLARRGRGRRDRLDRVGRRPADEPELGVSPARLAGLHRDCEGLGSAARRVGGGTRDAAGRAAWAATTRWAEEAVASAGCTLTLTPGSAGSPVSRAPLPLLSNQMTPDTSNVGGVVVVDGVVVGGTDVVGGAVVGGEVVVGGVVVGGTEVVGGTVVGGS